MTRLFCALIALFLVSAVSRGAPVGRVIAWGDSTFGQTNVPGDTNIVAISAADQYSMALNASGSIYLWGFNPFGIRNVPGAAANSVAISAGGTHCLALRADGRVIAWGEGDAGQTNVPSGLTNVTAIAAGDRHSLAVQNGLVSGWGSNNEDQRIPPVGLNNVTAIAAGGTHSVALRSDGRVFVWGDKLNVYNLKAPATGLTGVKAIASGLNHIVALMSNGAVFAWGQNNAGQCNVSGLSGIKAIGAGSSHSLYVLANNTVVARGAPPTGDPNPPAGTSNVVAVAAGESHSLGLRLEPVVISAHPQNQAVFPGATVTFTVSLSGSQPITYQWRKNGVPINTATNNSFSLFNVTTNDIGNYSVVASNALGAVTSSNAFLQVNVPVFIAQHPTNQTVAVGSTVTLRVVAGGTAPLTYQWLKNGTNVFGAINQTLTLVNVQPAAAGNYSVRVTNNFGALTSQVAVLTVVPLPNIVTHPQSQTVSSGSSVGFSVIAEHADGYQWHKNGAPIANANNSTYALANVQASDAGNYSVLVTNQFGSVMSDSAALTVLAPQPSASIVVPWGQSQVWNGTQWIDVTPPPNLGNVIAVAVGGAHSLALRADGTVTGWGDNTHGQAGAPPQATNLVAIAAGREHSVGLRADGRVIAWGRNNFNQTAVPPHSNVVAIAAGADHSLALQTNGIVIGWGRNDDGRATPPPNLGAARAVGAGLEHSLAVRSSSTVRGWGGQNLFGEANPPAGLSNVMALAAGDRHSFALRSNGTVVAWGSGTVGQTNIPPFTAPARAIASGANHGIALLQNGRVVAWGNPNNGQTDVPDIGNVIAIAAGGDRNLAVRLRQLELQPPLRLANGRYRLTIGNDDGSAVTPAQLAKVRVFGNSNLNSAVWVQLTNQMSIVSGAIRLEDTQTNLTRRFYRALENP
ncbi:MAG: immunoglobulin domain-containing protein [Verrucomicrobia subdivision 3 bacterium]|nr:immunoglobulin domain-containing protein [Limisphaerales bacterium]